ncbi:peptidase [Leptobacterium flavescens]|uniref:Peptidase n=1 Tax=Leptobacterium flavescens TaxID=472055 RepID=A0A6P0UW33_9FLAO|nr:S41 family peptidase [Leptobacterium flavescens]NER14993.1 peptidase [Leptobacterium flavescens]
MKKINSSIIILFSLLLWSSGNLSAQENNTGLSLKQAIVIDSIGSILQSNYVFPDVADKMVSKMKNSLKNGLYKSIKDPRKLADKLTEDLRSISHDKHLRVIYDPARVEARKAVRTAQDSIEFMERRVNRMKRENFGFKEAKILDGNIGYLNLKAFMDPQYAGETAVATMNFLSNTDALIIDLRQNGGGSPKMIQLITSYLYGPDPVHLNNFYWRPTDTHTQTWTLPHVSGKRNPDVPVYVLTSDYTFSAAEEFSYNLKNLKRATLIGETTGGGAHPGGVVNALEGFMVWVPSGRAINPVTNSNWEGTGVTPHIKVSSDQALQLAQIKALEHLSEKAKDPEAKFAYDWSLKAQKAMMEPVNVEQSILRSYTGKYGERQLSFENGKLYYKRGSGKKHKLTPLSQNEFMVEGIPYFRLRFLSEDKQVVAVEGLYDNGRKDKDQKIK